MIFFLHAFWYDATGSGALLHFLSAYSIPISWKKCELGSIVNWIGWQFNFRSGTVQIPNFQDSEIAGLLTRPFAFRQMQTQTTRKDHWLVDVDYTTFPLLRIWIHYLYTDLYSIPATHFSVDPGDWSQLHHHLSSDLHVTTRPPGTAIPIGGKLLSERHKEFQSKEGLHNFRPSPEKRIWLTHSRSQFFSPVSSLSVSIFELDLSFYNRFVL